MKRELTEEIKRIYLKIGSINKNSSQEKTTKTSYNSSKTVYNLHSYINKKPKLNIRNNYKNIYNIESYGSNIKSNLQNMKTDTFQNNKISDIKSENKKINKNNRKELNFIPNSFSDKKIILKENNLMKTTPDKKARNINKNFNFSEDKKESSKTKEEKYLSKIIFDKIGIKGDEKVLSDKSIKNFFTAIKTYSFKKNLKLANLEYDNNISDKVISTKEDEDSDKSNKNKTLNNVNTKNNKNTSNNRNINDNNTIFNKKNNETFTVKIYRNNIKNKKLFNALNNKNNKDLNSKMVEKNDQTSLRNFNKVDCNMVNLNLIDVPKINGKILDNYSQNENVNNIRKINSIDSKIHKKNIPLFEKTDNKFYSSKINRRNEFNIYE